MSLSLRLDNSKWRAFLWHLENSTRSYYGYHFSSLHLLRSAAYQRSSILGVSWNNTQQTYESAFTPDLFSTVQANCIYPLGLVHLGWSESCYLNSHTESHLGRWVSACFQTNCCSVFFCVVRRRSRPTPALCHSRYGTLVSFQKLKHCCSKCFKEKISSVKFRITCC